METKKKLFVLTESSYYVDEGCLSCNCLGVFEDKEDARKAMERNIKSDCFDEDSVEYHTEDAFSAENDTLCARYEITEHTI